MRPLWPCPRGSVQLACTQSLGRSLIHPFEKPENRAEIHSLMCMSPVLNAHCHRYSHKHAQWQPDKWCCRCTHSYTIENIRLKKVKSVKNLLLQSTHKNWVGREGCQIKNLMNSRDPIQERENKSVFTERTNTFYIQTCTLTHSS